MLHSAIYLLKFFKETTHSKECKSLAVTEQIIRDKVCMSMTHIFAQSQPKTVLNKLSKDHGSNAYLFAVNIL